MGAEHCRDAVGDGGGCALCGVWREAVVEAFLDVAGNGLLYPLAKWMDHRPHKPGHEKRADPRPLTPCTGTGLSII